MLIYRSSDEAYAVAGCHFAATQENAVAYTENEGFGGSAEYAYEVRLTRHLDASGRWGLDTLAEAYMALLDGEEAGAVIREVMPWDLREEGVAFSVDHLILYWLDRSPGVLVYAVLENVTDVEEVISRGYDWISFIDDFPEGSTTYKYLGEKRLLPVALLKTSVRRQRKQRRRRSRGK